MPFPASAIGRNMSGSWLSPNPNVNMVVSGVFASWFSTADTNGPLSVMPWLARPSVKRRTEHTFELPCLLAATSIPFSKPPERLVEEPLLSFLTVFKASSLFSGVIKVNGRGSFTCVS
eukprot:Lithocolla_globosa_v1_NODE_3159_length_1746_cov_105.316972.p2 type:complete len:118 gc:universal NODE_3159_length_1746_cov_105.316972:685-332(-)